MAKIFENPESAVPAELKGRYSEFRNVGAGGMGRIISATDVRLNRRVAIKLLPVGSEINAAAVIRFQQEARAVSKLNHPRIVQVHDFGFAESGEPFLVMEYVDGEDLETIIGREGKLPLLEALETATQVCAGLAHAHANGVVHRDLKPGNIMIDRNGSVRILDFGLAKILTEGEKDWRLTRPGQPVGSIMYMSPEQVRGEEADERADIYAAGLVLFVMLSGDLPHASESSFEIMQRRLNQAPPALPARTDALDFMDQLRSIVEKALQLKPEDRFQTMTALKEELERVSTEVSQHKSQKITVSKYIENTVPKLSVRMIVVGVLCILAAAIITNQFVTNVTSEPTERPGEQTISGLPGTENDTTGVQQGPLPHGFRLEPDHDQMFWQADDNVTDDDLIRLKGSGVKRLSLGSNKLITQKGLKTIANLPLVALILRDTKIGDSSADELSKILPNLHWLSLRGAQMTDEGIVKLPPSERLLSLDLKYLPKVTAKSMAHIASSYPNLWHINVSDTGVQAKDFTILKKLKHLTSIYAGGIDITDDNIDYLLELKPTNIELTNNKIGNRAIDKIMKLNALEWITFEHCESVDDEGIKKLQKQFPTAKITAPSTERPDNELMQMFKDSGDND